MASLIPLALFAAGCASAPPTEPAPIEITLEDVGESREVDEAEMDDGDEQDPPARPPLGRTGLAECDELMALFDRCSSLPSGEDREFLALIEKKYANESSGLQTT